MGTELNTTENRPGLPAYLTRFFGRETDLEQLSRALADPSMRVITLIGPGGVGKTRLAIEAVRRVAPALDGDLAFIDGAVVEQPALLLPEIADRLGIDRSDGQPIGEQISEALAGRSMLLVLDNMEHLLPAAMDIAALLRAFRACGCSQPAVPLCVLRPNR